MWLELSERWESRGAEDSRSRSAGLQPRIADFLLDVVKTHEGSEQHMQELPFKFMAQKRH